MQAAEHANDEAVVPEEDSKLPAKRPRRKAALKSEERIAEMADDQEEDVKPPAKTKRRRTTKTKGALKTEEGTTLTVESFKAAKRGRRASNGSTPIDDVVDAPNDANLDVDSDNDDYFSSHDSVQFSSDEEDEDSDDDEHEDRKMGGTHSNITINKFGTGDITKSLYTSKDSEFTIIVKTLRGELFWVGVESTNTIVEIREVYWRYKNGSGPPHEAINFIHDESQYFLREGPSLSDLGVNNGSTLLLVIGTATRHTGGINLPQILPPTAPGINIYKIEALDTPLTVGAPPPVVAAAASMPAAAAADDAVSAASIETTTARLESWLHVTAIWDGPDANTVANGNEITHYANQRCTYFAKMIIPPEILGLLGEDLSSRLGATKIGQAQDLAHAIEKIRRLRTYHPHAQIMVMFWLHTTNDRDSERAFHARFASKKGETGGEWFGLVDENDWFQSWKLFENTTYSTVVFASTVYSPKLRLPENVKNEKAGVVYNVGPAWSKSDKVSFSRAIDEHGDEEFYSPYQYDGHVEKVKVEKILNSLLKGRKFGRMSASAVKDIELCFKGKVLWACSYAVFDYTIVSSSTTKALERNLHQELHNRNCHLAGEYFIPPSADPQMSTELSALLGAAPSPLQRVSKTYLVTFRTMRRWKRFGFISNNICVACFRYGAYEMQGSEEFNIQEIGVIGVLDPVDKVLPNAAEVKALHDLLGITVWGKNHQSSDKHPAEFEREIKRFSKNKQSKRQFRPDLVTIYFDETNLAPISAEDATSAVNTLFP